MAVSDRVVADVARYQKVADHMLDVSWNPYETKRLYPYPPPWAALEAGAGWAARAGLTSFATAVKLPVLLADLLIVALLAAAARERRAVPAAPWLYAAHPVALLVGFVHGQFDAIALAFVLLAYDALARERRDASALALAGAIATKSFPVLLLPALAADAGTPWRRVLRYAAAALVPVALLLVPFAIADHRAVARELLAYSGIADFGWTALARGFEWLATGVLPRSEAHHWPAASVIAKSVFLLVWAALVVLLRSGRLRLGRERAGLAIVLAFLCCYGLLSAQYLLWAVPLGIFRPGRLATAYAVAATVGLCGFYLFLAPGTLWPQPLPEAARLWAGRLWLAGVGATLAVSAAWWCTVLRARDGARAGGA